jgi:carbamate kinase
MRIVIALGGNALLRRGDPMTAEVQRANVRRAVQALAPIAAAHDVVITHGNGPQVGLLALQSAAGDGDPLDVLDAETEGMIGYLIEQELANLLPEGRRCAALLTQIEVDPADPAFGKPTKPIGPLYDDPEAGGLARGRGWTMAPDGAGYRRVVPSPEPKRILELAVIELLAGQGVTVICAGGGGIPVARRGDGGLIGIEAVIDKDLASALLATQLQADALLMLTDVAAVFRDWGPEPKDPIKRASPTALAALSFAAGSMAPKIEAARRFITATGGMAAIGRCEDAVAILRGEAGTIITNDADGIAF